MLLALAVDCIAVLAPVDELGVSGSAAAAAAGAAPTAAAAAAAAARPVDMRRSTRQISNSFVAQSSSDKTYIPKLVLFIMWIFDNKREYISELVRPQMVDLDATDTNNYRALMAGRRANSKPVINKRTNLRGFITTAIENVPVRPGQHTHNSPIKIDGDGAIGAELIKEYMQTSTKDVWVDRAAAEEYLKAIKSNQAITDEMMNDRDQVRCSIYQSSAQYSGIRSAIAYLYKLARVQMPLEMASEMSTYLAGMDRTIRTAKEKLGLKLSEGKKPLDLKSYRLLCKTMFESDSKEDIFSHLFLVLDWCLMKRAENCANAKINHIRFEDDCLVFEFAKSKGHQKGEEHVGPWHVYANPFEPWLCPVLALARYLLCFPEVLRGEVSLFPGKDTSIYQRYAERFGKVVSGCSTDLLKNGYVPGDLGTHSARKGVGTMVAAGCTVSPPIVSLCIRAGWVLGGVKDKYLFRENAGDQYVGRCASCLDQTTKEFAVSPPYFDYSDFSGTERLAKKKMVQDWIESRLGFGADVMPESAHGVILHCFAAVCYHYKDLKEKHLHPQCMLRQASLFRGIPREIVELAVVRFPWDKTEDTPKLTGIPPHVLHMAEMEELKIELRDVKEQVKNMKADLMEQFPKLMQDFKDEMDRRDFGSREFNIERMMEMIASNAAQQTEAIVDRIIARTNLVATATADATAAAAAQSQAEYANFVMEEEEEADGPLVGASQEEAEVAQQQALQHAQQCVSKRRYRAGFARVRTRGREATALRVLPPNFKFPPMTPLQLIENWFIGDLDSNVPPLCSLDPMAVNHIKGAAGKLRKMRRFMRFVEAMGRRNDCWGSDSKTATSPVGWDVGGVKVLWEGISREMKRKYMPVSKRKGQILWSTPYNNMKGNP